MKAKDRFPWDYFVIAFVITWGLWAVPVLAARGLFSLPLPEIAWVAAGAFGPIIAAIVLTAFRGGGRGVGRFFKKTFNLRIPAAYLAAAVLVPIGIAVVARYVFTLAGGAPPSFGFTENPLGTIKSFVVLFVMVFTVGGGINEEMGWRAYATPRLLKRMPALPAAFLMGAIWWVWHLPLWFCAETAQVNYSFWVYGIQVVAFTIILTWLYINARGITLTTIIAHSFSNTFVGMLLLVTAGEAFPVTTGVYVAVAVILIIAFGPRRLSRKAEAEELFKPDR